MCTLRIVDGDYLAGRLDAEKAELHQQPMKSSKPGWRGRGVIWGFGKISREAAAAVPPPVLRIREGKPIDQFNLFNIRKPYVV